MKLGALAGENNPFFGKKHSQSSRLKMHDSHVGKPPSNKGKPMSSEQKEKDRLSHIGKIPWNKGKKMTPELIEKNRLGHIGLIQKRASCDSDS